LHSLTLAPALFAGCMVAGLLGLWLRHRLAEHHLDDDSRGTVSNITGLIGAMTALLLGLLVANAQSSYDTVSDEVDQMAANLVELDRALGEFGPDAAEARALLKRVVTGEVDRIWPPGQERANPDALSPTGVVRHRVSGMIASLPTQTEAQKDLLRHVLDLQAANARARVLVLNQVNNDLPLPIVLVVSFWIVTLFLAFGLLARSNAVVVIALLIGAASVGGAMFLVLELSRPFDGIMQISDSSMRAALALMGQ
jgi:hypothetical protein